MNTFRFIFGYLFLAIAFTFIACDERDDSPKGEYSSGVFVVNEGNFGSADGTVSFFNRNDKSVKQDVFGTANNGRALGDVVQSMTVDGNLAYLVINNSNKVEVVNANTFKTEYTIEDVKLPNYFVALNGKGYLTEWVSFAEKGRVSVINLNNRSIETRIETDYGASNILAVNNMLYVTNSFANTVSVINPSTNAVVKAITVGSSPGAFALDKNNKLWVVCGGGYDGNYNSLNDGALYQINTSTNVVEKNIALGVNVKSQVAINREKDNLYYFNGNKIYKVSIDATSTPQQALITEDNAAGFYGFGFDAEQEIIYAADAGNFSGNGKVYRYQKDGTPIDNFVAGRGPNGFVFR